MRRLLRLPRLWFSLDGPVDRFDYAVSGLLLVAVKYLLDDALFRAATGRHWSPWSYVQPSFGLRFEGLSAGSSASSGGSTTRP